MTNTGILYHLKTSDIIHMCVLLECSTYKCNVHNGKIEIISFCCRVALHTCPRCQFQGVEHDLVVSGIFYFKFNYIDPSNIVTKLRII